MIHLISGGLQYHGAVHVIERGMNKAYTLATAKFAPYIERLDLALLYLRLDNVAGHCFRRNVLNSNAGSGECLFMLCIHHAHASNCKLLNIKISVGIYMCVPPVY